MCTYLNFPTSRKCTMCSATTSKPAKGGIRCGVVTSLVPTPRAARPPKEALKGGLPNDAQRKNGFMVSGTLSRYINFYTGHSFREDLFFRTFAALLKADAGALNEVVNYVVNEGDVFRTLNCLEASPSPPPGHPPAGLRAV